MQILVIINGAHLSALLDSGSTNNCGLGGTSARGCPADRTTRSPCRSANGDQVHSSGCCKGLQMVIGDKPFLIDCYSLDLGSYDMVLRVQWLESLGPILWAFGQRTLTFVRNGHRVLWTMTSTSPHAALHTMSTDLMEELLIEFSPLF
jgi:hypothetical protein